ncbi:hypothetical protein MVEN_00934400 [Mycena venus]|uniref:Uncharacterized protein n=1 Tax=Mycena venus TaxID=2733690 RepID=A0A8H6YCX6_9AGAR|nr:hypothetical protein MVEN_00934400 [Mycena venus]
MLILLILVHLFSKNRSVMPIALHFAPRSSTDTCDDINNCRKLFDIVWSCLATIFACTWVSVHPNVPPPNQSWLALFWRRLKMMLIGIIAPEIMVGFAAGQFWGARILSKGGSTDLSSSNSYQSHEIFAEYSFSRTHGFFFCMGGFVSAAGYPVATKEQLEDLDLGPEFLKAIQNVDVEDIRDKSKGDVLSKGVALAQGIWFTTQCFARMHQHLEVTELEVATLAFAVVNIFIWLLWWDKPLDVQRPLVVGLPKPPDAHLTSRVPMLRWNRFLYAIFGTKENDDYNPLSSTSVPSFWSLSMDNDLLLGVTGITTLGGSVLGAVHCAAWNTNFPTTTEMWIWRACSLMIAAIPVVSFIACLLAAIISETSFNQTKLFTIMAMVLMGPIPVYILARLILIVLPPHGLTLATPIRVRER